MMTKKKRLLPLFSLLTLLTSCGSGAPGLSADKFYRVNNYIQIDIYNDGTTDCVQFDNGIFTVSSYGNKTGSLGKRQIKGESHTYFKSSGNLLYIAGVSWATVLDFKTEKDDIEHDQRYKKPDKPEDGYYLCGEYGDGWLKLYSGSSRTDHTLYVTEGHAKKVGMTINIFEYNESNNRYSLQNQSVKS